MKCRRSRDNELTAHRQLYTNIDVHPWLQLQAWIRKHQPHWQGPRIYVQLGEDVLHSSIEDSAGVRIDRDRGRITRFDFPRVALEYLGKHPNIREVSDGVQHGFGLRVHVGQSI